MTNSDYKFKVRFHLSKGVNFMKWQVTNQLTGNAFYLSPECVNLSMNGCKLVNRQASANKIFNGDNKSVVAWILCNNYEISSGSFRVGKLPLSYNPRICPHWILGGMIADNETITTIVTSGRSLSA